jgi:hypothetical protein
MTTQDGQRDTVLLPLGERQVVLRKPTEGQMLVLTRLPRMIDTGRFGEAVTRFGDILEHLIVQEDDLKYAYDGLVDETIEPDDYLKLLLDVIEHWKDEKPAGETPRKRAAPKASTRPRR